MYFYFETRKLARAYGAKVGKNPTDMGANSAEGRRWAVCVKKN